MGTKSGYKLFPLNSIERMEPSFEKGETRPEFSAHCASARNGHFHSHVCRDSSISGDCANIVHSLLMKQHKCAI